MIFLFHSISVENSKEDDDKSTFVDPSYTFSFHTPDYQRREDADITGRVRGLYSFTDDVGEKHLVRYAASADRGFEVFNSVPDASRYVQYSAPLYKAGPKVRGRIAYERGPGRRYKFIAAGPDQRRSEYTGADGITRGSFSYLDDKGTQRTTQYIAGPGIGYRIVQATTGPGTHLLPRPSSVEFGILYPSTNRVDTSGGDGSNGGGNGIGDSGGSGSDGNGIGSSDDGSSKESGDKGNRGGSSGAGGNKGNGEAGFGSSGSGGDFGSDDFYNNGNGIDNESGGSGGSGGTTTNRRPGDRDRGDGNPSRKNGNRDWSLRRDYLTITNKGNSFLGVAPGKSARAHVQNIDVVPYGDLASLSPSEKLRLDEQAGRFL